MSKTMNGLTLLLLLLTALGCGGPATPDAPPTVGSTAPARAATAVATNTKPSASFSVPMDAATVNASTFLLRHGATAVAGIVSYNGTTATFAPLTALAATTTFAATLTTGIKDAAGNALSAAIVWEFTTGALVLQAPVLLGGAGQYAILAQSGISTVPTSAVTGDIAVSPAAQTYITGFSLVDAIGYATSTQVVGRVFAADQAPPTPSTLTTAVNDMGTAYVDAAGRPTPDFLELGTGEIGGLVLVPGLYKWTGNVTISADVVLAGSATDVWILQMAGNLSEANGKSVTLRGGAKAANVFWQVAGAVDLGTTAHFEGIILCKTAIAMRTGASFTGRALAQTAVTLQSNAVTQPASAPAPTAPTVTSMTPARAATAVASNATLSVTFTASMDATTVNASTFFLRQGTTVVPGTVGYDGTAATFAPAAALAASTTFTATLTTGIKDAAGVALASDFVWDFTTAALADTTAPVVAGTIPMADATDVGSNSAITATFSEDMSPSTMTVSTFTVAAPDGLHVAGTVTNAGSVATFQPTTAFAEGTHFTVTLKGGVAGVTDLAGNALAQDFTWSFNTRAHVSLPPVFLGGAGRYAILAQTAISTVPTSAVIGDMAISPAAASYITGFSLIDAGGYATSAQVVGKVFASDYAPPTPDTLTTAVNDMGTAYVDAAGRPTPDFLELGTGAIGGLVLVPGLYKWTGNVTIASDVVLEGSATDVWILQMAGNLSEADGKSVTLRGGAKAANVFWQVAGAVDLGTTAHFEGIILCKTAIAMRTGASFNGRALAQTAVTMDSSTVTQPAP